jgi:hypothetical protein
MPEVKNREEGTDSLVLFHTMKTWGGTEVWLHTFLTYIEVSFISSQLQARFPFNIMLSGLQKLGTCFGGGDILYLYLTSNR